MFLRLVLSFIRFFSYVYKDVLRLEVEEGDGVVRGLGLHGVV